MPAGEVLRLVALAAIWGSSFLFMSRISAVLGALPTSLFRAVFAAAGLIVGYWLIRRPLNLRGHMRRLILLGSLNSAAPVAMYAVALSWLPTGYMVILNATVPLMAVLVGALFFQQRTDARKLAGVVVGLLGVGVLVRTGPVVLDAGVWLGVAACLVATTCYAFAGCLTQRWLAEANGPDAHAAALGSQMGAALVLLPVFFLPGLWGPGAADPLATWSNPSLWLWLLALGVGCTSVAFLMYFGLIARIGMLRAQTVTFLVPLFGVFWGATLLGETLSWAHAGGGVLILLATAMILMPSRRERAEHRVEPAPSSISQTR